MVLRGRALNLDLKEFEAEFDEEVAKLGQAGRQFELHQWRADLMHQMEQRLVSDTKLRLTMEEDLAAFVHNVDKDRLLRDEDMARFKREVVEASQDHEMAREHLLARLRHEREFELRALKLEQDQNLSRRAIAFQIDQERQRLDHDLATQRAKLDATIASRRVAQAADLEMESERRLKGLELGLAEARTDSERARIKLDIQKQEDEHDLAMLEKKRAIDLHDQRERMAMAMEAQRQQVEVTLKLQAQQFAHEAQIKGVDASVEKTRIQSGAEIVEAKVRAEEARKRAEEAQRDRDRERERSERDVQSERGRSDALMDRMERVTGKVIDASGRTAGQTTPAPTEVLYKSAMDNMGKVASAAAGRSDAADGPQIKCAKCGHRQADGSRFCEQCGSKLA